MKIIMGGDPLQPPLTGIGRYTFELVKCLSAMDAIHHLKLFRFGQWMDVSETIHQLTSGSTRTEVTKQRESSAYRLRRWLGKQKAAVWTYSKLSPFIYRQRLKDFEKEYIYHGPNFYLPPFDGPSVTTIHDLSIFFRPDDHPKARADYISDAVERIIRQQAHIITVSEAVKSELIEYFGIPDTRATAVLNGVSREYRPRVRNAVQQTLDYYHLTYQGYIFFAGTIEPRKNHINLINAYSSLDKKFCLSYPLILAGADGWHNEKVMRLIHKSEGEGCLKYLGFVPERHLPHLFSGAKAVVYPSYYEGFGLPVLEAMASGVPVLTSNLSSMPEVAGDAGLLVDPNDTDSISAGIEKIVEDEDWRQIAITTGIERARQLSWEACARHTTEVYKSQLM